jgi:DNA invertase Pin-like site-specific DNA recombinase
METSSTTLDAAVYNRVSDDKDGRSKSTAQQGKENLAACAEHGWTVAGTYTEPEGASASRFATKARVEWERLIADLKAGKFGVVVVWETSRSGRRMGPFVDLLDECADLGVLIHVTSHGHTYDPNNWRDRKTLLEDGIAAEGHSEETSQRIRRAVRSAAAEGRPTGRYLYGYRREYDPVTREFVRQVPDEEQAAIVREMFTRFAAGESLHTLSIDLNRRGVPVVVRKAARKLTRPDVPPQWDAPRLSQMLNRQGYIGKRVHQGQVIGDAVWPPLVDEETFWICQERLRDPSRRWNRGEYLDKHLLSGVALCATCGAHLRKVPNHSHRMIYQCKGRGGDHTKGKHCTSIVADVFEEYVTAQVIARLSRPDAVDLFTADRSADRSAIRARILAAQDELAQLRAAVKDKKLSVASLIAIEPGLEKDIAKLEDQLPALMPAAVRGVAGPDAAEKWTALSLDQKKAVMKAIADIRLHKTEPGTRIGEKMDQATRLARTAARVEITWKTP